MGPLKSHSWKKGRQIVIKIVDIMGPLKLHSWKKGRRSGSKWGT